MDAREVGLLLNALKNKESGFFLVAAADNVLISDLLLKLKIGLGQAGKKTASVNFLERKPGESAHAFVRSRVEASPDAGIFFLLNLESSTGGDPANFLRQLNQSRESLYSLNREFVFIISPDFARLFSIHAKDLFSWIPQRYSFEGGPAAPREFAHALRMDEEVRFKGDKDRKYLKELIALYEEQLKNAPEDPAFRIANIIKPLADLYNENDEFGKELPLRQEIVEFYKGSEERYSASLVYLGNAYQNIPVGDREENLKKTIEAYREVLKVYTIEAFPVQYAMAMNNLGNAYQNILVGDRAENLKKAIETYREALKVYTIEAFPVQYAMAMNNLGTAYQELPIGDRAENFRKAIEAYKEALRIYTIEAFPVQYAGTMNNLRVTRQNLPERDRPENPVHFKD